MIDVSLIVWLFNLLPINNDKPGELCCNFPVSNDFTQMFYLATMIPDCDSLSPALMDIFLSSNPSICSTVAFHPLENPDHVVVSVSIVKLKRRYPVSSHSLMTILMLIGMVYLRQDIFRFGASAPANLDSGPRLEFMLLLILYFVSGSRFELIFISLMVFSNLCCCYVSEKPLLLFVPRAD